MCLALSKLLENDSFYGRFQTAGIGSCQPGPLPTTPAAHRVIAIQQRSEATSAPAADCQPLQEVSRPSEETSPPVLPVVRDNAQPHQMRTR